MTFQRQTGTNFKPPKPSRGTADGQRHMARVKVLPCVICDAPPPSDAHHCISGRYGSRKASDFETIPLCKTCHQIGPLAIHQDKAGWQERNGMDHEFLAVVADALAGGTDGQVILPARVSHPRAQLPRRRSVAGGFSERMCDGLRI